MGSYAQVSTRMSDAEWSRSVAIWRRAGVPEVLIDVMGVGCPVHGNARMDADDAGVFCCACESAKVAR